MTDEIRPIGASGALDDTAVQERRDGERRLRERRRARALTTTEPAPEDPTEAQADDHAAPSAKPAVSPPLPPAVFAAQVIGQAGQKRGLKGGAPVLDTARSTYLGREYSGLHDRRPPPGGARKTEA